MQRSYALIYRLRISKIPQRLPNIAYGIFGNNFVQAVDHGGGTATIGANPLCTTGDALHFSVATLKRYFFLPCG
jgi:hypothetical protein